MNFESFEQALQVCMTAEPNSELQDAAIAYCLENAPPELKAKVRDGLAAFHQHRKGKAEEGCGCGCGHDHHHH